MKLYLRNKPVLDEREMQEMYRIEHHGLWAMYMLLCASVVVQLLMGADMKQMLGEVSVIAVVSIGMIIAYARRGIWDVHARPSARGNVVYAALSAVGVAVVVLGRKASISLALGFGAAMFVLCYALLTALMRYVQARQEKQDAELENE